MIYEVIENKCFDNSKVFSDKFIKYCKYNHNEPHFILKDTKE